MGIHVCSQGLVAGRNTICPRPLPQHHAADADENAGVAGGRPNRFLAQRGQERQVLEKYLSADSWNELMSTYPRGTYEEVWEALFTMGALFRRTALDVAERLGFEYDMGQDQRVTGFLQMSGTAGGCQGDLLRLPMTRFT